MSKLIDTSVTDAALNFIANNVTEMYVCSGNPTTRAEAITNALATKTSLTSSDFTGPAAGDVSGRKITKDAETGITVDVAGTAAVACFCSASTLLWKTDLGSTQVLSTGGNTVDVAALDHEVADVTA